MTDQTLRITVVQEAPVPRDPDRNLERVHQLLTTAESDLLVFPELFLTGYQTAGLAEIAVSTADDPRISRLSRACRDAGTALLVGFVEPDPAGFFDSYLAVDRDGTVMPPIRKTHLFGGERDVFLAGDSIAPVELCGTRVGVINCFELEFPEVARTLALRGASVLVAGSANMHPYELDHRTAATARALENRLPLAYANRVGSESGHDFCGSSRIISADGATLAELDTASAGCASATVTLTDRPGSHETDMLAQLRPELYEQQR